MRPQRPDAVECKTCKSQWFEQVRVQKVNMNIMSSLGTAIPEDSSLGQSQVLLRCIRCKDLQDPPVNVTGAVKANQDAWNDLLDTVEKPWPPGDKT